MSILGTMQNSEIMLTTMNLLKNTHRFDENERNRVCNMLEKNGNTFKKDRVEKKVKVWREKRR